MSQAIDLFWINEALLQGTALGQGRVHSAHPESYSIRRKWVFSSLIPYLDQLLADGARQQDAGLGDDRRDEIWWLEVSDRFR